MVSAQLFNNKITLQENFHIQFWYFKRILHRFPGWRSLVVLAKKLLKSLISARRPSWQVNQLVSRILADKPNWALALHIQYTYKQIHAFLSTSLEKHYILQRNRPSIRFGGVIPNFFFLSLAFACTNRFKDEMLKRSFLLNAFWPQYPLLHFVINVGLTFGHQSPF